MQKTENYFNHLDTILLIVLVSANLGMNLDHFYDPLDSFSAMQHFPVLSKVFLPGGEGHPLVILGKQFTPVKLFIRSLSA